MRSVKITSAGIAAVILCLVVSLAQAKPSSQRNLNVGAKTPGTLLANYDKELESRREDETNLEKGSAFGMQRIDSNWPKSLNTKPAISPKTKSIAKMMKTKNNMFSSPGKPEQLRKSGKEDHRLERPEKDGKAAHATIPAISKRSQSSPISPKAPPPEQMLVRPHPSLTHSREASRTTTDEHDVRTPGSNSSFRVSGDVAPVSRAWNTASCCGKAFGSRSGSGSGAGSEGSRIVGGVEVSPAHKYPWQVALSRRGGWRCGPFCGGSVINSLYVLTAAHCTEGEDANRLEVCLGMHSSSDPDVLRVPVSAIVQHARYNSTTVNKDMALLRLSKPVQFGPKVVPVCLPEAKGGEFTGVAATISGWGSLSSGGRYPQELMEVGVQTVSNHYCSSKYGFGAITRYMLCAYADGKDSCQGDSGGPLTTLVGGRHTQIGVVSFGIGCAKPGFPGVYARVTSLREWIKQNAPDGQGC